MTEQILTRYGWAEIEARPLSGSRIFVVRKRFVFPAGSILPDGNTLKRTVAIPVGAVLLPRWDEFGKPEAKRVHNIFPYGLYEAIRAMVHARFGYGLRGMVGELTQMQRISKEIVEAGCILIAGTEVGSAKIQATQAKLTAIALELEKVINEAKRQARDKIAKAATLEVDLPSGKKVKNRPATTWRLGGALTQIKKRLGEIRRIAPWLTFFETTLTAEIGRIWADLNWLRNMVEAEKRRLEKCWSKAEQDIFRRRCGYALKQLAEIDANPFQRTVGFIKRDLKFALRAMNQDRTKTRAALGRILAALRFKDAGRAFEARILLPFVICLELGTLTPAHLEHMRHRVKDFMRRLGELDETGFINPPKAKVTSHLQIALDELNKPEPDLKTIKEALKAASHLL